MNHPNTQELSQILEACLLSAGKPLSIQQIQALIDPEDPLDRGLIRESLHQLQLDYADRGIELVEVSSGWRFKSREKYHPWVSRLWEEKPQKYSRALLETLALIAYRQPITRGEIESIRGVSVSSQIVRTLQERNWVRILGHRDVPGRPALLGTTRQFLDYFNLKSLDALPALQELTDLGELEPELALEKTVEEKSEPNKET